VTVPVVGFAVTTDVPVLMPLHVSVLFPALLIVSALARNSLRTRRFGCQERKVAPEGDRIAVVEVVS